MLDGPAGNWAEGRRPNRFARTKVETGMMPGAADRAIGYDSVGQWAVVVSAFRTDCEKVITASDKQDGI
jgi:hypothetical protein